VWELHLLERLDGGSTRPAVGGGGPLSDPVDGEDGRRGKSGEEKGAGGVGEVMLEGEERAVVSQSLADDPFGAAGIKPGEVARRARGNSRPELARQLLDRRLVVGDAVDV